MPGSGRSLSSENGWAKRLALRFGPKSHELRRADDASQLMTFESFIVYPTCP